MCEVLRGTGTANQVSSCLRFLVCDMASSEGRPQGGIVANDHPSACDER